MSNAVMQPILKREFTTDAERWQALAQRDKSANGHFCYSVKTTGVYCRPSCPARRARRENVRFHLSAAAAERAGFRACKRCRPNAASFSKAHTTAVAQACAQINNSDDTVNLAALAQSAGMSTSHFHRMFKALTGVTPKAYAAAQRTQRVRRELRKSDSITNAVYKAGFNSNGRFYAAAPKVLGMTPTTFRAGGKGVVICFAVGECALGSILVAASAIGICAIALGDDPGALLCDLQDCFPRATLRGGDKKFERLVAAVIGAVERPAAGLDLPLDIQGTAFQQRVWQLLRQIPCGQTRSYAEIAVRLGQPKAIRAVARACAANKIAVVIPCHRVVRTDGSLSGYRWGVERKAALLQRECAARTICE